MVKIIYIAVLFFAGITARILPHPANFTPIAAIALFGGTYLSKRQAFYLPILIMLISDGVIGFDNILMRLVIYGTFLLCVIIGLYLKKYNSVGKIIFASFFSSILFFVITNFAVWLTGSMYTKNLSGLASCYVLALPFFRNTILGDLFYSGVFFGGFELIRNVARKNRFVLTN